MCGAGKEKKIFSGNKLLSVVAMHSMNQLASC